MDPKIIDIIQREGHKRVYRPGEMIFRQGDIDENFYFMKTGLALAYVLSEEGKERSLLIIWPEHFFGVSNFFAGKAHMTSSIATKHSELIAVDRAAFQRCKKLIPELTDILAFTMAKDVGTLIQEITDNAMCTSDEKVARFICRRVGEGRFTVQDGCMVLEYTQDFIASIVGASRWSVNQSLMALRDRGWLATKYGTIIIKDYDAIRRFGYGD